jgi:hypothetical protein
MDLALSFDVNIAADWGFELAESISVQQYDRAVAAGPVEQPR